MAATGRSWTPRASVCSVLRVSNRVIEFSQQDTNKRITGVMISDFTFKPRDSISLQFPPLYHGAWWQFIIPATKSICSTPSVRLSIHPQTGSVHHRASTEKTKKLALPWRRRRRRRSLWMALRLNPPCFLFPLSIKANSWMGLQYFPNYLNGLDIGQWGAGEPIAS